MDWTLTFWVVIWVWQTLPKPKCLNMSSWEYPFRPLAPRIHTFSWFQTSAEHLLSFSCQQQKLCPRSLREEFLSWCSWSLSQLLGRIYLPPVLLQMVSNESVLVRAVVCVLGLCTVEHWQLFRLSSARQSATVAWMWRREGCFCETWKGCTAERPHSVWVLFHQQVDRLAERGGRALSALDFQNVSVSHLSACSRSKGVSRWWWKGVALTEQFAESVC